MAEVREQAYELVAVSDLTPHPENPNQGDVGAIAESVDVNGFYGALVVQRPSGSRKRGRILAGNHRWLAAKAQGIGEVPVIWVDVDDDRAKRIMLADNRTAQLASYDESALAQLLTDLAETPEELAGTGWDGDALDELLSDLDAMANGIGDGSDDEIPSVPSDPVTKRGDVWLLGDHRVMCGDCRLPEDVAKLLDGATVNLAFTSPPYADRREYDDRSGFRPIAPADYVEWFRPVAENVDAHLANDGSWFVNINPSAEDGQRELYVFDLVLAHVREWDWMFVDEFCWRDTNNGVPGGWPNRFKDAWEPVFHFAHQTQIKFHPLANGHETAHAFDYSPDNGTASTGSGLLSGAALGEHDGVARPSNVVEIKSSTGTIHSAAFPHHLPAWFIRAFCDERDAVFDPFMGSGSTLIAAEQEDRVAYGMEVSGGYVDVICRRYQRDTGDLPILEATGEAHDFGTDDG